MNRSCNKRSTFSKLRGSGPTTPRPSLIGGAGPAGGPRYNYFYRCNNNNRGIKCSQWYTFP
jgi:hypothetical protein